MVIFAFWDATHSAPPRQAELVAKFVRATLAAGDTPRLLTARDAAKSRRYREAVAAGMADKVSMPVWALRAKLGRHLVSLLKFQEGI